MGRGSSLVVMGQGRSRANTAGSSTSCRHRFFVAARAQAVGGLGHAIVAGSPVHLAGALGRSSGSVILFGIISGALFYGDAIITPALSVLSAVEGLNIVTPHFETYVVPITVLILIALFAVQSRGTASVARLFGPLTLIWFVAIAAAGFWHIGQNLSVLYAFNPYYGVNFLFHHGIIGFYTLGAVFLVVTGSEALYADLGHFGRGPIRFAWLVVVLPALVINYLGQGALVLADPKTIENPFFLLFPQWALLPMVLLATAATVIASQAVITGA